jgi:hypothetical protein
MRASRMLQRQQARAETRWTERKLAPIVTTAVNRFGGGGEFHDTSGFHERDTSWHPTIGFTFDPYLDRGGERA